jgi:hypothetical protein
MHTAGGLAGDLSGYALAESKIRQGFRLHRRRSLTRNFH